MRKELILGLAVAVSTPSYACKVNDMWWEKTSYNAARIRVHIDTSGCKNNTEIVLKAYEGNKFLGTDNAFITANAAKVIMDLRRPATKTELSFKYELIPH